MNKILTSVALCLCIYALPATAQKKPEHKKGNYVDKKNRYYQQAALPIYLFISNDPKNTNAIPLKGSAEATDTSSQIKPMYLDGPGIHHIRHTDAIDKKTINFLIYGDGYAPKTQLDFLKAPRYATPTTQFFGKGLEIKLSPKDDMSGVNSTWYSTNKADYTQYQSNLSFDKQDSIDFRFYSVDNVGNEETIGQKKFVVDLQSPETSSRTEGLNQNNIIAGSTSIILTPKDNLSGIGRTYYRFDKEEDKAYLGGALNTSKLGDGDHTVYFYSVDNVANKEEIKKYDFYLDRLPPILADDILGDRFIVNDQIYFSGRTKLKITAVDNKSGVKEVRYSINGEEFALYNEPFYLPSRSGIHIIRYFATDNMNNQTVTEGNRKYQQFEHNVKKVYVDLTGPALSHNYIGNIFSARDTIFITSGTKIQLNATDSESGLQYISYGIDKASTETKFDAPFSIPSEGFHNINMYGYDNVNNRNTKSFEFVIDNTPPEITSTFSIDPISKKDGLPVYPPYTVLYIAAKDKLIGTDKIFYSVNGMPEMPFKNEIRGFKNHAINTVTLRAIDKLSNSKTLELKFYVNDK